MKRVIAAKAYRDGKWWTFEIPDLGMPTPSGSGATMKPVGQAKTASKVAQEAQDLAASWVDGDPDDFEVAVQFVLPERIELIQQRAEELEVRGRADLHEAAELRRQTVRGLLKGGVSQVDAATVLGLSRQRVQQLA
ncbi:hypothetical protein [Brevibacterium aurantiacum]|uniref:Antitoxin HicB n=1 Tax=Brevibacterium aurantiacum TaxID=273384 RepID=A0A556C2U1_BREAU|nr:hypothetical protein [Brevibacterium aurantiacum]TSI11722.1 hypothetical protein FO013_21700 [Brevibacterium aurantiacum]